MTLATIVLGLFAAAPQAVVLEERIDLYDPVSGVFLGAETTWFTADGKRLRLENRDADGNPTLLFFVLHDEQGREAEAIYFEGDAQEPTREVFGYEAAGRVQTVTYFTEPGVPGEQTRIRMDAEGRERHKQYFRADGSQYGEEDVLWRDDGNQLGWDFRYVGREGGASFRYEYQAFDEEGRWTRRMRSRDGNAERLEVRSLRTAETARRAAAGRRGLPGGPDAQP